MASYCGLYPIWREIVFKAFLPAVQLRLKKNRRAALRLMKLTLFLSVNDVSPRSDLG